MDAAAKVTRVGKSSNATMTRPPDASDLGTVETLLAACWLMVAAIQGIGTYLRTSGRLSGASQFDPLSLADLTPHYAALAVCTAALVAVRTVRSRRPRQ